MNGKANLIAYLPEMPVSESKAKRGLPSPRLKVHLVTLGTMHCSNRASINCNIYRNCKVVGMRRLSKELAPTMKNRLAREQIVVEGRINVPTGKVLAVRQNQRTMYNLQMMNNVTQTSWRAAGTVALHVTHFKLWKDLHEVDGARSTQP